MNKMNLIDKLVAAFDPIRGLRRAQARKALASSSWWSADNRRRGTRSWAIQAKSAKADINPDLPDLRSQSRDLIRNNPIAAAAINLLVDCVVGSGLTCSPDVEDSGLAETLSTAWDTYADSAEVSADGMADLHELIALAYRSMLESGDVLLLRVTDGDVLRWQVIEADRLCNPGRAIDGADGEQGKIFGGVEIDDVGRPLAYHLLSEHPGDPRGYSATWERRPARDSLGLPLVIHLFHRTRPGQTRGVPLLAPVCETLYKLGKFIDAELDAAVTGSFLSLAITSESGTGLSTRNPSLEPEESASASDELVIAPNEAFFLRPGESVQQIKPEHPSDLFGPFVETQASFIGAAIGIPKEVLLRYYQSSYSASRAALQDAWRGFFARRDKVAKELYSRIYETFIAWEAINGRLAVDVSTHAARRVASFAEWTGTAVPQLDPVDEVVAARRRIETGISNRTIECAALTGREWEAVIARRAAEDEIMRELGMEPMAEQDLECVATHAVRHDAEDAEDVIGAQARRGVRLEMSEVRRRH